MNIGDSMIIEESMNIVESTNILEGRNVEMYVGTKLCVIMDNMATFCGAFT